MSAWEEQAPPDLGGFWRLLAKPESRGADLAKWREELLSTRPGLASIPADSDVPVWLQRHRMSVAGAVAATQGRPAFLSFRLAGVQEFIDRSRTTADYWSASSLLAHAAWEAARPLVETLGPDTLIFPRFEMTRAGRAFLNLEGGVTSFPSGFLAIVPAGEAGRALAEQAEKSLADAWRCLSERARQVFCTGSGLSAKECSSVEQLWKRQASAESVLEVYWALKDWGDPAGFDYRRAFKEISASIESRKTLRMVPTIAEPGLKCHQDGIREALPGGSVEKQRAAAIWRSFCAANWAKIQDGERVVVVLQNRFRESERLSSVAVIKRLAGRLLFEQLANAKISFPSTLSVAVVPFLERLAAIREQKVLSKLVEFLEQAKALREALCEKPLAVSPYPSTLSAALGEEIASMDGSWWYDTSYRPAKLVAEYGEIANKGKTGQLAAGALESLRKFRETANLKEPSRYLTVLCADADNVGRWIAGSHQLRWADSTAVPIHAIEGALARPADLFSHIALTESLSLASAAAVHAIEALGGRAVYAGGDDLLAFCPAGRTIQALDRLAQAHEAGAGWHDGSARASARLTLSASALIVPANNPLASSVEESSRLLHEIAKDKQGRAAASVGILRQSGQETVASAHWTFGAGIRPWADLQALVGHLRSGTVSPRGVAKVEHLRHALKDLDPRAASRAAGPMLRHLFGIDPSRPEHQEPALLLDNLARAAASNAEEMGARGHTASDGAAAWLHLEAQLLLARFLMRQEETV